MDISGGVLRFLCLLAAGYLIWRLWLAIRRADPVAGSIAAIAVVLRVVAGVALFGLLHVDHPALQPLKYGPQVWFFAGDVNAYLPAAQALSQNPSAILSTPSAVLTAPIFTRLLALGLLIFGGSATVGLLLNTFAHLGICWLIARWPGAGTEHRQWSRMAIAAFSFAPSWILWATQPLKEPVFVFSTILFFWTMARLLVQKKPDFRAAIIVLVGATVLWAVAEIRWYFALTLLASFMLTTLLGMAGSRGDRASAWPLAGAWLLFPVAFAVGARPYLLPHVPRVLTAFGSADAGVSIASSIPGMDTLLRYRSGFERTKASTAIQAGFLLRRDAKPQPAAAPMYSSSEANPALPLPASEVDAPPVAKVASPLHRSERRPGQAEPAAGGKIVPSAVSEARAPAAIDPEGRREHARATETPNPVLREVDAGGEGERTIRAVATGLAALLLPRFVGSTMGLVEVGGGRGFWSMAEIDTLFFDAFLFLTAVVLLRRWWARTSGGPVAVGILCATLATMVALAVVITNFGTLMRHREMVFIGVCLLPLVVAVDESRRRMGISGQSATPEPGG